MFLKATTALCDCASQCLLPQLPRQLVVYMTPSSQIRGRMLRELPTADLHLGKNLKQQSTSLLAHRPTALDQRYFDQTITLLEANKKARC